MESNNTGSPLNDIEFLARSESRTRALAAIAEQPQSRADLRTLTQTSSSTVGRMLREFEKRHRIRRNGHQYEATQLGVFIASGMRELIERLETEHKLRDGWQWLPTELGGFTIEMCANAAVTVADVNAPYRPVNRFISLLQETTTFRFVGIDVALLEPCKDELRQRIINGMQTEIIDPPSVARYIHSTYREHCAEPLESGNLTVLLHENLPPYGISIFDDRIAISGYNSDSGAVQMLIDTDAPEMREWAESIFESYRREARPLTLDSPGVM